MTEDRYLEVDGARLRYRVDGEGAAIVLVHGWALDLQMWDPQVSDLARRRRVIRFDRRGFGLSSGDPGIAADAADVRALCRHLGVERSAFVGMSQGARVLERLTAVAPELISCLVFDGPPDMRPGGQLTRDDIPIAEYAALVRTQGLDAFRRRWVVHPLMRLITADQSKRELLDQMLARYQANDLRDAAESQGNAPASAPRSPVGTAEAVHSAAAANTTAKRSTADGTLPSATVPAAHFPRTSPPALIPPALILPVLIITGALDLPTRKQAATELARLIPAAQHAIIPNAGHLSNIDNSITYNDILLQFLASVAAR